MNFIGAELVKVIPGEVEILIPFRADLTQQHGFLHAGIITTIVDSACGYAAFSLMPVGASVLTIEFKVNIAHLSRQFKSVYGVAANEYLKLISIGGL